MTGNSNIFGMGYPVAAAVDTYTEGTSITYDTGFVIGTGVEAVLNAETGDNEDWGDDELQDFDNGLNGINGSLELNSLELSKLAQLLGWVSEGSTQVVYHATDGESPYFGFGYYFKDVGGYVARWIYRVRFSRGSHTARTKQQNVEWNHPTLEWRGTVIHLTTPADKGVWHDDTLCATREAAKAWLNSKAGISTVGG